MNDINVQIATAAEEQSAVAEEINRNVVMIRDVGLENSAIANSTADNSSGLVAVAETLKQSVNHFQLK